MPPLRGGLRGFQAGQTAPSLTLGKRLELPAQRLNEYRTNLFSELDWEEGQVYSYNLSIQRELFPGTKLKVGYVGNQGRHIRNYRGYNGAMPEGYVVPLAGGGAATTSDPLTAPPRSWVPGDTEERGWSGQQARRPYPQVPPQQSSHPDGNTYYSSLQIKLERRLRDGLATSMGYTWSRAMALNYIGEWASGVGFRFSF